MPIAGHHPYVTPTAGPFPEGPLIGRYRNALHYSDQIIGSLVQGLRDRGLLERTLLVIFGDHGEAFGEHAGNFGHSIFIYEENIRVPYLVVAPGLIRAPICLGRVVSLVDTAPTVLDLLGMARPASFQGRSILEDRHNMALFCTDYSQGLIGLRDERWKFIHNLDLGRSQLFDLEGDPMSELISRPGIRSASTRTVHICVAGPPTKSTSPRQSARYSTEPSLFALRVGLQRWKLGLFPRELSLRTRRELGLTPPEARPRPRRASACASRQ